MTGRGFAMTGAPGASSGRRWTARLCALAAAATIAGCAGSSDVRQLRQSDAALRGMVATDRQQIADLQNQVNRLNDQLVEMRHNGPMPKGPLSARVARLEREVAALKQGGAPAPPAVPGAADAAGATAPGMPPPPVGASAGAAPPIGAPMLPPPGDSGDTASAATAPSAANPPELAAPSWRDSLAHEAAVAGASGAPGASYYRSGLAAMQAGSYTSALAKFQALQRRYPKSQLGEPAEYFSAVALDQMGKYDQAILQYNDLAMRFPKGRFAAAALFGEAQAFVRINDRIDARLTLQKLLNDHPNSPQAPPARSMMASLANG